MTLRYRELTVYDLSGNLRMTKKERKQRKKNPGFIGGPLFPFYLALSPLSDFPAA